MALTATLFVANPLADGKGKGPARRSPRNTEEEEEERGRSRISKNLGGYGSTSEASESPTQQGGSSSVSN